MRTQGSIWAVASEKQPRKGSRGIELIDIVIKSRLPSARLNLYRSAFASRRMLDG